jgi:SAM-dependent methyltransferase
MAQETPLPFKRSTAGFAMDIVFDQPLIAANRRRALNGGDAKAAFLLDIAADEIADRLSVVERRFEDAVELYGATGITASRAMATGRITRLVQVETGPGSSRQGNATLEGSLEEVPLEPASVNLILSPLSLHLTNDTPGVLIQMRRALKPDGLLLAAIPGAGTLQELRDVLLSTEIEMTGGASPRVIPFPDVRDVGGLLQRAGFALPVIDTENYTVRYDSIFPLMRELRAMGMANPLTARSRRPLTRGFFLRAAEIYAERYSDTDGRIRATFSIIYASGWAPHESQQKPLKPGSAKARLADALKVPEHPLKQ